MSWTFQLFPFTFLLRWKLALVVGLIFIILLLWQVGSYFSGSLRPDWSRLSHFSDQRPISTNVLFCKSFCLHQHKGAFNSHVCWKFSHRNKAIHRQGTSPQYQNRYLDLVVWHSICQTQPNLIQRVRRQCCLGGPRLLQFFPYGGV